MSLKDKLLEFAEKGEIKSFMIEFEDGKRVKMSKGRQCKECGISINHKHINAKFCKTKCKDDYHNRNNPRGYADISSKEW